MAGAMRDCSRLMLAWGSRLMATSADLVYRRFLRPLLFRLEAETAHRVTLAFLAALPAVRRGDPAGLATSVCGIDFVNPVGVAAGVDKDARAIGAWQALGFGFAELGTITPRPQSGNERPRMWRLPEARALVNRLGFPGAGMEAVRPRLERARRRKMPMRLGLNFGPNKLTPTAKIIDDYAALLERLGPYADFMVINVSSPNTPGLRDWQAPERLGELLARIAPLRARLACPAPLLVKLAPDLDEAGVGLICETSIAGAVDGIVAGNTTLARAEVGVPDAPPGGLSGAPLRERSRTLIRRIRRSTNGALPIIGVGGVASAEDAYGHILAGASLVELYTALVYEGPVLVGAIKQGLIGLLHRDGWRSIGEAVGREK